MSAHVARRALPGERLLRAGTGAGAIATVQRPYRTTDVSVPSDASTWVKPDADALGATRRQLLDRGITGFFTVGLTGFGAATVAFLWPELGGGFGWTIRVGNIDELCEEIRDDNWFLYKHEGRMWVTEYRAKPSRRRVPSTHRPS